MLNELFYESVPVILKEEDLNCMNNSIENRAPYLDKSLIEFLFTIPTKMLIRKGFTKFLLREVSKKFVSKEILYDTRKVGFNYSINSVIDLKSKNFYKSYITNKNPIFKFLDIKKMRNAVKSDEILEKNEKFFFNFINASIFLKLYR